MRDNATIRLSADVGGTFTDVAAFDETTGELQLGKTLTTPQRLVAGIENGVGKAGSRFEAARLFLHGTTVAINTILERSGARCALLTTQGFRDIYEIGRVNRPEAYNLGFRKHKPLIDRDLRFEIMERIDAAGHGADQARRGAGARGGQAGGGAGRAGDRHPVPAFLPQSGARAARQGDHRAGVSRPVRHRLARAFPGVSRVRAHLDGGGQRLYRPARAAIPDRDGATSRRGRLRRQLPDRAVDRRAVRRRRRAALLHPHAGIGTGGRRDRHQGAVRFDRHEERHRLRHGRHHRQGRRDLQRRRADDRRRADRRLRHRPADPDADDRHPGGRHRRRLDRARRARQCAASGPGERGRCARPGLLRARRHRADHHRRQPGARAGSASTASSAARCGSTSRRRTRR